MFVLKDDPVEKINKDESIRTELCVCEETRGLFIRNRQLSWLVAVLLLSVFSVFMAGYFLGQKKAVNTFTNSMQKDSSDFVADTLYSSMQSVYDATVDVAQQPAAIISVLDTTIAEGATDVPALTLADNKCDVESEIALDLIAQHEKFYAQLIGFGTEKAAQAFTQRLQRKSVTTTVKKRRSKTPKGKLVTWYQVVTDVFEDKSTLMNLISRLEKEERLKGVHIVTC